MAEDKLIEFDLRYRDDNTVDITLSYVQRMLLRLLASRAGESEYDFNLLDENEEQRERSVKRYGEPLRAHIRRMVTMGLMTETPILSSPKSLLRLTPMGRNVVTQIGWED